MHVVSNKPSSRALRALLAVLLYVGLVGMVAAQSETRSFPMTLWGGGNHDSDIPAILEGDPQPAGRSIVILQNWGDDDPLAAMGYDWSRIVAVMIDEPYGPNHTPASLDSSLQVPNGTPACGVSMADLNAAIMPVDTMLEQKAKELRALAPTARFWVNFSWAEANWMGECANTTAFNRAYIDVVSADWYYVDFDVIQPFYSVVAANPPPERPDQQLALVPGTFFRSGVDMQATQASHLQGFFDYANTMNQNCDLPLGTRGGTGYFDGCRVWMVMGWLAGNYLAEHDYRGEEDPTSSAITGVWRAEQLVPVRADLARPLQLERGKMVQALLPLLLNN